MCVMSWDVVNCCMYRVGNTSSSACGGQRMVNQTTPPNKNTTVNMLVNAPHDCAHFRLHRNLEHGLLGQFQRRCVRAHQLHCAVILAVDVHTSALPDTLDDTAAGADDRAQLCSGVVTCMVGCMVECMVGCMERGGSVQPVCRIYVGRNCQQHTLHSSTACTACKYTETNAPCQGRC